MLLFTGNNRDDVYSIFWLVGEWYWFVGGLGGMIWLVDAALFLSAI